MIYEAELKKSIFSSKKKLTINETSVSYGDKQMLCHDIKAVKYGSIQIYVNGVKGSKIYEFGLLANNGEKMRITFNSARLFTANANFENIYSEIISALWNTVTKRIVTQFIDNLNSGKSVVIGNCEVQPSGVKLKTRKWFIPREIFVEWKDLLKHNARGYLFLYPKYDKRLKCRIKFLKEWNSMPLLSLLDWLWEGGRAYELADKSRPVKVN